MTTNNQITFAGHATVYIEMDGLRLLTDPVLRPRIAHLTRLVDVPDVETWKPDVILISHMHWDHLDLPSLLQFGAATPLIVPKGAAKLLKKKGFKNIEEVDHHESVRLGNVDIIATPAAHNGNRTPFSPKIESLGYIIDGSQEIYFAGDTDLFPEMEELGKDIDIALLPVWGYGPTLGSGHLDPYRAAKSLTHLTPNVAIPIHWGTYCPVGMMWMQLPFLSHPPHSFAKHAGVLAPEVDVHILQPGEAVELPGG